MYAFGPNQQPQQSPVGASPPAAASPFGTPSGQQQARAAPAFRAVQGGLFEASQAAQPVYGASPAFSFGAAPAFGAPTTGFFGQAFGSTGFGAQPSQPAFGAASTPSSQGFGAASTAFGAQPAPASPFGGGSTLFGGAAAPADASPFGAAPGGVFGGAAAPAAPGTRSVPYAKTMVKDGATGAMGASGNFISITAMPANAGKCFEELRFEDYQQGVKSAAAAPPSHQQAPSPFGSTPAASPSLFRAAQPAQPGEFGFVAPAASSPFGAASTPAFGAAASSPFGAPADGGLFGATAAAPAFGGGFGAPAAAPAFGQSASATGQFGLGFGAAAFGMAGSAPAFGAPAAPASEAAPATGFFGQAFGSFNSGAQPSQPAFGAATSTPCKPRFSIRKKIKIKTSKKSKSTPRNEEYLEQLALARSRNEEYEEQLALARSRIEEYEVQLALSRSMNEEYVTQLADSRANNDEYEVHMACVTGQEDVLASQDLDALEPLLVSVDLECLRKAVLEKRVQRELNKAREAATECGVCLSVPKDTSLYPCGHTMCRSCSHRVQICPICRQRIAERRRVFL